MTDTVLPPKMLESHTVLGSAQATLLGVCSTFVKELPGLPKTAKILVRLFVPVYGWHDFTVDSY